MRELERGEEYPYHGQKPKDWAERAALGILWDLSDRRGIKHELDEVDQDVRVEIVQKMAEIIRAASSEPQGGE